MRVKKPYTELIFLCPHCRKYIAADLFKLKDLNKPERIRLKPKQGVEK